jgi:alkylation response protein AidB-like acyl-CoA dehydrogenase
VTTTTMDTTTVRRPQRQESRRSLIFSDEHEQLRESIHRFVVSELAPHAAEWEQTTFPDSVYTRMGELGFLGLNKPERYGGQGGDFYSSIVLAEELAHSDSGGVAGAIGLQTDMAIAPVLAFGTEEQKQRWAVPGIQGTAIISLGITEPDAGSDVAGIRTRAVRDGDDWVINGAKTYITSGIRAHMIVLVTKTGTGKTETGKTGTGKAESRHGDFTVFLVPMDLPGVIRERKLDKLGLRASDTALLSFQDVRVPDSARLGEVGKGFYNIMWELQAERLIGAASSISFAQIAFDRTLEYAKQRQAFGRPIAGFQVIRHKFAEMAVKLQAAREFLYMTAWRYQNGDYPTRDISMAKVYATRIAVEIADECIQIHGGAGYMTEVGIERTWRDLRLQRIGAGTDEVQLDIIGRSFGI